MKITGQIEFTSNPMTATWRGGPFAIINGNAIRSFSEVGNYGFNNNVAFPMLGMRLRVIQILPATSGQGYQDSYVVMQDGRFAQFMSWYYRRVVAYSIKWSNRQLRKHPELEGTDIPKWTLPWLLWQPLLISYPQASEPVSP